MPRAETVISNVVWETERETVAELFREYVASLDRDIGFQGFEKEFANLPGKYAPPRGAAFLARVESVPAAVAALRPIDASICEMKRLYVRPQFRGRRIGEILAQRVIGEAAALGYTRLVLDTLESMHAARQLYAGLGFRTMSAYYDNPLPGTTYMAIDL